MQLEAESDIIAEEREEEEAGEGRLATDAALACTRTLDYLASPVSDLFNLCHTHTHTNTHFSEIKIDSAKRHNRSSTAV